MKLSQLTQSAKARLAERMAKLGVRESDLAESFARSSGPGGQHVNKVSTAVTLKHLPSGIAVTAQDSRSQAINRQLARERLLDAIERRKQAQCHERAAARAKARRKNSRRPRGLKERILESKKRRSATKQMRGKVGSGSV